MDQMLMVGVKVFLQDQHGRYLLLRRSTVKYPEVPPSWDIPGGRINIGTPLIENLQREIYEETGLTALEPITLLYAQDIIREDKHVVRLTYKARVDGQPRLDIENDGYCWFTVAALQQLPDLDEFARGVVDAGLL